MSKTNDWVQLKVHKWNGDTIFHSCLDSLFCALANEENCEYLSAVALIKIP